MRILLIEDDEVLADVLLQALTSQHYAVDLAADGSEGLDYAQSADYDLLLVDVGLPRLDGITLCQRLRSSKCTTPILLMTAKDATHERIRGLDAGADDYLTKPLDMAELQARVRALLRRGSVAPVATLQLGDLHLDPATCQVNYGATPLSLTPKEYSLLELFLRNPARVFSRGQIVQHLWTFDDPPLEESVKAHIKGLRQKLKTAGAVDWIENVYGIGYRLKQGVGSRAEGEGERGGGETRGRGDAERGRGGEGETGETGAFSRADFWRVGTTEQKFNQAMGGLWQQYRGVMVQRLEVLQRASQAISTGSLEGELRQQAERAAHKLAGVLGMFEREAGTQLAREIEQILLGQEALSSQQEQQVITRVQELGKLMNLGQPDAVDPPENDPPENAQLLLIASDSHLGSELQVLAQPLGLGWQRVETLAAAQGWLRSHPPSLVALSVESIGLDSSLQLLADLAARTPPVPALVLAAADNLIDRVTVARAGGQSFLVQPVTAAQVWEAANQLLQRDRVQRNRGQSAISVLVVDDDPVFLAAMRSLLHPWGMSIIGLEDPLRFWDVLNAVSPDLLILDVEMPAVNGIELCQAVRLDPAWQGLPILFLTARKDSQTVQRVFSAGADDFILKPVVGPELLTRITNRLERHRLLQTLSTQDPITGVTNQPQSSRALELLLHQVAERNQPLCLLILSIVELQSINLEYGHATGNQVLQRWGQLFRSVFCSDEVVGYWGNGEFVIGIAGLTAVAGKDHLVDVLRSLRRLVFTAPNGKRFQVTCRVAIAEFPSYNTTLQGLYQAAMAAPP